METLLLGDAAFVDERYHALEAERARRRGASLSLASRDGAAWPLTPAERHAVVMAAILDELRAQTEHALAETLADDRLPTSTKDAPPSTARTTVTPPRVDELPVGAQLALRLFFRVSATLPTTAATARVLAGVAAKVPAMLARLPPMALSPGVVDAASDMTTVLPGGEKDSTDQPPRSAFGELLEMYGALLEAEPPRGSGETDRDKTTPVLSDVDRANVLMAYVAVSLKWGRLRDLVDAMRLLIELPGVLTPAHVEQLWKLVEELIHAEAVVPAHQLLPEESSASGYLVSFGKGDHGKLGHGQCSHASCTEGNCTENKNVPTVIASTRDTKFVKIDSLSTHSVAITTKGEVMAWGNGDKYRLGHGTTTKEYSPRIIDSLSLKGKVADVACGLGHTIALMATGDIYAWGNGSNGRLGLGDTNDRSNPTKLVIAMDPIQANSASSGAAFRYVMCGASHSLAVTSDGRVFAWGKNNQGQCGHGHTNDQLTAIEVRHFREELSERVVWAAGGWEHTLFCSASGRVYSCGCGYKDSRRAGIPPVLGHGDCEKRLKPTVIQTLLDANEEMVRVSCGWDHSLAVSAQGSLYTWGSGTNGKLGHGDEENCEVPTLVRSLAGKFVKDAKAGCEHTVALTDTHELWTFGQGDSGRLGLGDTMTRKTPTLVDFYTHSGLQPVAIAVGDKYNLILADDIGPANPQGALKSPVKRAPTSPPKFRSSSTSLEYSFISRPRKIYSTQSRFSAEDQMSDLRHLFEAAGSPGGALPRDQAELLKVLAVNVARIASGYVSNSWCWEGSSVEQLPYGIDAAPVTLERLLSLIHACQDCLSLRAPSTSTDLALELIIVCLRILTANINMWNQRCERDKAGAASTITAQVEAVANDFAARGVTSAQQALDSDRSIQLQARIQEEAANVLRVGFTTLYSTTADRTRVLYELGVFEHPFSIKLSPRTLILASKLCEDYVAHDIILDTFRRSLTHQCVSIPPTENDSVCPPAMSGAEPSGIGRLMTTLVNLCTQDTNQRLEHSGVEKNETLAVLLRLLAVYQGHWFGVAACRSSRMSGRKDASPSIIEKSTFPSICGCCIQGLSEYLLLLVGHGGTILKNIRKAVCQSEDAKVACLDYSLIDSVLLQAVHATSALLALFLKNDPNRSSRSGVSMARTLLPGVRCMLQVLDEICWKLNDSTGNKTGNTWADGKFTWVNKLSHACALLAGQIAQCFITSRGLNTDNQKSGECAGQVQEAPQRDETDNSSSCFYDGLTLVTDLLRQLNNPSLKDVILLKLSDAIKAVWTHHESSEHEVCLDDTELSHALPELCCELTAMAASEEFPFRARVNAVSIWLWVLGDLSLPQERLSELIIQSGVVVVAGEILIHDPPQSCDDRGFLGGVQQLTVPQRTHQPSSKLRLVEDIITTVYPSQALSLVAQEVLSAAANHLCSSWLPPISGPHPLSAFMETNGQSTDTIAKSRPTSSPRRCHTLPKKLTPLSVAETIKVIFDHTYRLLQKSVDLHQRRQCAITPFLQRGESQDDSMKSATPSVAFLLASPLSISNSRSQIVKRIRLPSVTDASQTKASDCMRAISLWFIVDALHQAKESTPPPVVVLTALGEATDRLQEGASSPGSSMALELGVDDRLRAIVYLESDNGQLCLGCAFAYTTEGVVTESSPQTHLGWESMVVEEPIERGRWIHLSICFEPPTQSVWIYVDGKRAHCRSLVKHASPNKSQTQGFGKITSRLQLVVGGTLDDNLKSAIGLSSNARDDHSSQQTTNNSILDVIVDDVWLFPREIDDTLAERLHKQGQVVMQLKQNAQADQQTLAILVLLNDALTLLPDPHSDASDCESIGADARRDSVASRLYGLLLQLMRTHSGGPSFQIALLACEAMKQILPVATAPSREVLDALMVCMQGADSSAFDLGEQVSKLFAFSTRAGVQSAAVASAQLAVASLLRQTGVLRVSAASGEGKCHDESTECRHLLAASVIDLVQRLSCVSSWQPHFGQVLNEASLQLRDGIQSKPILWETLAAVTVVAGYSEGFVNIQAATRGALVTLNKARKAETPWTSARRSPMVLLADPYAREAWQFGCGFQCEAINLGGRAILRDSQLAHDVAVLGSARLQALVLRSFVAQLYSPSQPTLVTNWQRGILSDARAMEAVLCGALIRTRHLIKSRLGSDNKTASRLKSVQLLKNLVVRSRSSRSPRLLIQDDLEVVTTEIQAKLESQLRPNATEAGSLIRQHYWRDPRQLHTPLESLSGEVEILGLAVRAIQHFPTIRLGRATITANSGLWYHEVHILSDGLMQIGYVDTEFVSDAVQGQGVGDHTNSWAFDGYRRKKWNVSSCDYGESWQAGDVVGVLLDTDRLELSYFLNGKFLGVAFSNLPLSPTSLLFPAISLNADQRVRFDFGASSTCNKSTKEGRSTHDASRQFHLPRLGSTLDSQRLRAVALAMDESNLTVEDPSDDELVTNDSEFASDDDGTSLEAAEADGTYSPLATPTTPISSQYHIYHPSKSGENPVPFLSQRLPGSLVDEENEPLVSESLVDCIQATFGELLRENKGDDNDHGDKDERDSGDNADREVEVVQGLVALGFPESWAIRCARETTFTLNDSGAVPWILEQMESEASSSVGETHLTQGRGTDETNSLSTTDAARRAHDDLSVGLSVGQRAVGRRTWQLALSPTRDGRPHSEQFLRSRVPLSSSSRKQFESVSEATRRPTDEPMAHENPFLLGDWMDDTDEEGEDDDTRGCGNDATTVQRFYSSISSGSLRQRFAMLDLSTVSDSIQAKHETPRNPTKRGHGGDEDLLPASLVAHSVLSLAYVRLLVETLLFGQHSEVHQTYPIVAQWASGERPGLFRFLRRQLQLDARELPVSVSRAVHQSDERRLQKSLARLLQHELEHAHAAELTTFPLHQSIVAEILAQVAKALRRGTRAKMHSKSVANGISDAMGARWTLWLVLTLRSVQRNIHDNAESIPIATRRGVIQDLVEPIFVNDVTRLAARATSANTTAWRNVAFSMLHTVLLMVKMTEPLPLTQSTPSLNPVHFLVELLAKLLRKDQSRQIAFPTPISTLWEIVLAHSTKPGSLSELTHEGSQSEIVLRVEQIASTYVTISWECAESQAGSSSLMDGVSSESASIDSSVLSLRVIGGNEDSATINVSPSKVASGVPHFLPSKGSLVLRQLVPDTIYTIRIIKSPNPLAVSTAENETHDSTTMVATVVRDALVRTPPEPTFELDPEAAGKNLVLSNRNRTVKNLVNKKWHTVRASVGFDEGVHHWHVRIDSCVSKNIFIGVATADASLENYVGSDAFGYGFLANKAVWHNKSKIHSYGEIFKQGDLLQVTLDCGARTLSYSRNGEFLGVAATNLHVATGARIEPGGGGLSSGATIGCKWYPAFSLYNKDDQLTLLVPRSPGSSLHSVGQPAAPCQHASVLQLIASARYVLTLAKHQTSGHADDLPSICTEIYRVWRKWSKGDMCWREVGLGEVIEIDARRDVVVEVFGLAPGDAIFTSRGQCVVLGSYNHELWYEVADALVVSSAGKATASLGCWSLSACRDMVSAPDEYPVHRVRRYAHQADGTEDGPLDELPQVASHAEVESETDFHRIQTSLESKGPQIDALLVSFVDAIATHRGLRSPYQLSYADLSSAIVLHDVVDTLRVALPHDTPDLSHNSLRMRLAFLLDANQHVYRCVRLFLSSDSSRRWEQSVCAATGRDTSGGADTDPERERKETLAATARLAASAGFPSDVVSPVHASGVSEMPRRELLQFLRDRLFTSQREQLISEALRRTATPTLVGLASDADTDPTLGEPREMFRLKIRLPSEGRATPFWRSSTTKTDPWVGQMPPTDRCTGTLFAQVHAQLSAVEPSECRRQCAVPRADHLPSLTRTFHLAFLEPSSSPIMDAGASHDASVLAEHASQYLTFWDDIFIELQSPRFPLFIPVTTDDTSSGSSRHPELDLNVAMVLPECGSGGLADEALAWFFQLGQLLGMVWRAKAIVPLQFVSRRFWTDLLLPPGDREDDDGTATDPVGRRRRGARTLVVDAVRDGLCTVVPYECLQLSSPASLRRRLSDTDVFAIDRLQCHAVYDRHSPHHVAFWATAHALSSLERQALLRFLGGKLDDDPIEAWQRQLALASRLDTEVPPSLFRLELVDALADAQDHPDACFPVVHVVDAHCSRLHLPAYSSASVLRHKLLLAMSAPLAL